MTPFAAIAAAGVLWLLAATAASAQTTPDPPVPGAPRFQGEALVSDYSADLLRDLPSADNLFNIIDVLQPSIIGDRFAGGGLAVGQPGRLGGFLTSWTQTIFSVDGVPFSDPSGTGAAMLWPELLPWSKVRVRTGAFPADNGAQGLSVDLLPPTPGSTWTGLTEAAVSHGRMSATGSGNDLPPISRLSAYDRIGAMASGPLSPRVGATFAASMTRGSQLDRYDTTAAAGRVLSGFSQFVINGGGRNDVRIVGWGQHTTTPFALRHVLKPAGGEPASAIGGHGQLSWTRTISDRTRAIVSASYSMRRDRPGDDLASGGVVERLQDGPIGQFSSIAKRTVRAWSGAARAERRLDGGAWSHRVTAGVQGYGGQLVSSAGFSGAIGELVNGIPARVWQFAAPAATSDRNMTTIAGHVEDTVSRGRLTAAGGLRLESVRGSAQGAVQGISWTSLLPRARITFQATEGLDLFGSYTRSAQRLTLDTLAYGDPAAPIADVFRWTATGSSPSLASRGALITTVGPGTGGTMALTAIDPALRRPTADEFVFGVDARPIDGGLIRVAGIARREHHLMGLVNVGNPSYTTFTVADPGPNVLDDSDDTVVTVYNRVPASFGKDLFQLTTPGHSGSTLYGIELTLQYENRRVMFSGAATAAITDTYANSIGYGPLENDQTVVGDLFTNPNAAVFAKGRSFNDRAFTGKIATVLKLPAQSRLGLIARYQDGQNFARVLVFPDLNQGAEAVRAFANGDHRFMFVGTLDVRLQKTFTAGTKRIDAFIDGYNVLNLRYSVEEKMATLPDDRTPTVLQPPLSVHAGLRVRF